MKYRFSVKGGIPGPIDGWTLWKCPGKCPSMDHNDFCCEYDPSDCVAPNWDKAHIPFSENDATLISTEPSEVEDEEVVEAKDADHVSCECDPEPVIDPVYADVKPIIIAGIGLNRSRVILCRASSENLGGVDGDCPERDIPYLVHINRITERQNINRSTNVKQKN